MYGFSYNLPISGLIGITPGLYYSLLFSNDSALEGLLNAKVREHFVNVPVAWRHSATYGLMCEYEMPPKVLRFLNALVDTFRGENVERERRMP